ncbi:hypothetical protein BWI97_22060 [Siphonobacter sp. BAB-5405]|nr:hypothetical protein BWI97_22060 [Siphonobacter sp. BAB-5405]
MMHFRPALLFNLLVSLCSSTGLAEPPKPPAQMIPGKTLLATNSYPNRIDKVHVSKVHVNDAPKANPVDVTARIVNPSFESSFTGWTNQGLYTQTNADFNPQKAGNTYAERWVGGPPLPNVSLSQKITGLPNGQYTLVVGAQNITQNPDTGQPGGFVFANNAQTEVGARGEYSVDFLVIDSTAVIGFKTENSRGNWMACDNFRLHYKGAATELMNARLQTLLDSATTVLGKKMQNARRTALESAVSAAQQSLSQNAAGGELANRIVQMQTTLAPARVSAEAYRQLQVAIDSAMIVYGNGTGKQAAAFLAVIDQNKALAANLNAELSEVEKAPKAIYAATLAFRYANASSTAPLDMTKYIVNPGFDNNNAEGWKGGGTVGYHAVEFYQRTFNFNQSIAGLPAGKYVLKAQAFERPKHNDAGAAYTAGTETIHARLYAQSNQFSEKNIPFPSLYKHPYSGSGSDKGYINTMASAEVMFTGSNRSNYQVALTNILLDENDVLTIGAKSTFQQGGYWALMDHFRLEYLGGLDDADYVALINDRIVRAQQLLAERIQSSARQSLRSAISGGQQAVGASPRVTGDLVQAKQTLNASIAAALGSKSTYDSLQRTIAYATKVLGWYTSIPAKKDTLQPAISRATAALNDSTLTGEQLRQASLDLRNVTRYVDKKTYMAGWMMGDMNNPDNNWSYTRSVESKDWIIVWEKGFNTTNPDSLYYGSTRCDVNQAFEVAQRSFDLYADSLKFITRGNSKSDTYKMVIRLRYAAGWEANGSGVDDMIGLLTLSPWAFTSAETIAHEAGHCFQYQTHCDNYDWNGWLYGFGPDASGGNAWWEQCAQWQAYKVFPELQFNNRSFWAYLNTVHKHLLHEAPRYDNFFIQDYWVSRHGLDIIGRLWNQSIKPEDPVEAYQRITGISQKQFNDEMYDCAAKFASWDLSRIRSYGASVIASRPQPKLNDAGGNYWRIDPSVCLENYGHNIIQLNVPTAVAGGRTKADAFTTVRASFQGLAGTSGYRANYVSEAGWRYGFVALLSDGTRLYSPMQSVDMTTNAGVDSLSFQVPTTATRLWLIVSGAPKSHWRHAWDDNDSNDEQWPYQVRFAYTNLLNEPNVIPAEQPTPVSLVSFAAEVQTNKTVEVSWKTAGELHNKAFIVERSLDLSTFEKVAEVYEVAGTSTQQHTYRIVDEKPYQGTSYYRLIQVDRDGTPHPYRPKSVLIDGSYLVYPNPVQGSSFRVSLDEPLKANVSLSTVEGRGIPLKRTVETDRSLLLKAEGHLSPGVYLLKVEERAHVRTHKIVVK